MDLVKVKCMFCGKEFFRRKGQFNEAKKFSWKQYCSHECLSKDRTKRQVLFCENCGKALKRTTREIPSHSYCSQSCAAIVNNKRYPKRRAKLKICANAFCNKQFKGNLKYCSKECKLIALQRYTPQALIGIIKEATQKLKRVPAKRELKEIADICAKSFGSWNNAIIAAGFQPNRSHNQRMYKCANVKALDGHFCDSISEAIVDDWLTKNKILHKKNVPYPETNHKADWAIFAKGEKVLIEYFGLAKDSPRYDRTISEKKKLSQNYKLKLIEIYPWDLYPKRHLDNKLRDKFRKLGGLIKSS